MTAHPPDEEHHDRDALPRWVPVTIGVVLVTLAALAVVTGLRYRNPTLVSIINARQDEPRPSSPAPPGEPEPGGSLVVSGHGANAPAANEAIANGSSADISGGPGGVSGVMKLWARRGMKLNVTPRDTLVYVNDVPVGTAQQLDSDDEVYDFAEPGSYTVRLVAPGHKERQFIVTASEAAADEVATITARLERE
ncbi:MAG TPA: hypothetical protein VMS98_14330 [Thermoanaerobaculia bacterium]|nr:hypothetical protein [Thermoanaerobaculia bacterium]